MTATKKIYFMSDLHLGASYEPASREKERRIVDFLESIADDAAEIYLVGDIIDYWFEYRTVVPRGYVRFFGALARLVDRGVKITWLTGNHDIWLFDYLRDEIGITIVDGSLDTDILGSRFYIAHGDGVGRPPRSFRFLRAVFRNRACQKLYASIHPRWTVPMALRWSSSSRRKEPEVVPFKGEDENLIQFARQQLSIEPDINYFIFGHRHLAVDIELSATTRFIILGDWLDKDTYGVFDGKEFSLHSLKNIEIIAKL